MVEKENSAGDLVRLGGTETVGNGERYVLVFDIFDIFPNMV